MKTNENKKKEVALSSVFAGLILTATKFIVGLLTGSIGIISEAIHSSLDFISAIMTFFAVKLGDKPADKDHPYGHGKIESISALITTGLLFVTSIWIIYESIHRLVFGGVEMEATWYAFAVVILSIIIDISRSRALLKVAKETKSQALEADALHFASDIWSSAVVLVGLFFVSLGFNGADAIAAIGVALFVAHAGYELGRRTIDALTDKTPEGTYNDVFNVLKSVDGVLETERIRIRPVGPNLFIEISILVNRKFSMGKAQEIIKNIEDGIKAIIPEADIIIHTKSIQLDSETIIESVQVLAAKSGLSIHGVVVDTMDDKKYISYDLELPGSLTIAEVHNMATRLEDNIKKEFGEEVELNCHMEPLRTDAILSSKVTEKERENIMDIINRADGQIKEIKKVHNVLIRRIDGGYFVSLHCLSPSDLDLDTSHTAANRFEYLIRKEMKEIRRVIVHVEPEGE